MDSDCFQRVHHLRWEAKAKERSLHALMKEDAAEELRESVGIVDAKSLFDHLSKETVGTTSGKGNALEMQVIRQSMSETGTCIKWVPHPCMIVDALTKRSGNLSQLCELLDSGVLSVVGSNKKSLPAVNSRSIASNRVHSGNIMHSGVSTNREV